MTDQVTDTCIVHPPEMEKDGRFPCKPLCLELFFVEQLVGKKDFPINHGCQRALCTLGNRRNKLSDKGDFVSASSSRHQQARKPPSTRPQTCHSQNDLPTSLSRLILLFFVTQFTMHAKVRVTPKTKLKALKESKPVYLCEDLLAN